MSLSTPPSRRARGLMVPDLDTKFSPKNLVSSMAYGGLHTPPQSAHESRRTSMQSSWTDTPYSATGPGFAHSLPSTPIHRIQNNNDGYVHGWSEGSMANTGSINRGLDHHFGDSGFSDQGYHSAAGHGLPLFPNVEQDTSANTFGLHFTGGIPPNEPLAHPVQTVCTSVAQAPCLGAELFPMSHHVLSETILSAAPYDNPDASLRALTANLDINTVRSMEDHAVPQPPFYHQPQVIVPSQLSPQDVYDHSQLEEYTGLGSDDEILTHSFASSSATLDSFELMDAPSPTEMYFERSGNETYLMVKSERPNQSRSVSPSRRAAKSKGRCYKRSRGARRPWHRHETGGIEVRCEGKPFSLEGPADHATGTDEPLHRCTFIKDDGERCGSKFKRSEHLKRHALSHTPDRPYPCPIEKCKQASQRADNACQHFQTHLRPPVKGKRNPHVAVDVFQRALWEIYDPVQAQKMWVRLEKWIRDGMPDPSGRRGREHDIAHTIENGMFTPVSPRS